MSKISEEMNDRNTDAVVHLLRVPFNGLTDCQNVPLFFTGVRCSTAGLAHSSFGARTRAQRHALSLLIQLRHSWINGEQKQHGG